MFPHWAHFVYLKVCFAWLFSLVFSGCLPWQSSCFVFLLSLAKSCDNGHHVRKKESQLSPFYQFFTFGAFSCILVFIRQYLRCHQWNIGVKSSEKWLSGPVWHPVTHVRLFFIWWNIYWVRAHGRGLTGEHFRQIFCLCSHAVIGPLQGAGRMWWNKLTSSSNLKSSACNTAARNPKMELKEKSSWI